MADYSLSDMRALLDDDHDGWGNAGFLWVILIFLFFLAFSGGGLFGNRNYGGMEQVERDVLTTSCNTQKEVLQSNYNNLLGFKDLSYQNQMCCCDLKTAIHAEGEATRALIQDNTIQELRDRLTTANNALTVQTIVNQVVSQIRPCPVPAYLTCSPYASAFNNFGCNSCCGNF